MAAKAMGVRLKPLEVRASRDLEGAVQVARRERANAFIVLTDPITHYHRAQLADIAAKHRLPTLHTDRLFGEAGGLMSSGASQPDTVRRLGFHVDKILKGTKPADIPVEQPARFDLIINLKTAKALGLTIPQSILISADEVIR